MAWCNEFGIHDLFNNVLVSLLSILIPCIILYEHSCLHLLYCTWLRFIRICIEDLSHWFLANRWLVHSRFIGLGNPLKTVVHHLLIGGMASFGYWDGFPMVSVLVYVMHTRQDLQRIKHKAINCHDSLSYYTTWTLNLERILSLCQNL